MLRKDKRLLPKFSMEEVAKSMECEKEVRTYAPELLDELQGIADGSGVDDSVVAANELSPYRLQPSCLSCGKSSDYVLHRLEKELEKLG